MPETQHTTPLETSYARSILELANERGQTDLVAQELSELAKVIESDPAFETFLANPAVGEADRTRILESVFKNRVSPLVYNFLGVMNRKGRLGLLRQVAGAFEDLLEAQRGIIEVDVFVAQKLSPEQLANVQEKVGQALKRQAVVHQYVDESIIGGIRIRVEDRLLDASVRAQLNAVRRQLLAARPR